MRQRKQYTYTIHGTKSGSVVTEPVPNLVMLLRAAYRLATEYITDEVQLHKTKMSIKDTINGIREQEAELKLQQNQAIKDAKAEISAAKKAERQKYDPIKRKVYKEKTK